MVTGAGGSSSYSGRNWSLSNELAAVAITSDSGENTGATARPLQSQPQAFEWIAHGEASARKRARAHVTRCFRRQQKEAAQALRGDVKDETKKVVAARHGSPSSGSGSDVVLVPSGSHVTAAAVSVTQADLGIHAPVQNQMAILQMPEFSGADPFAAWPVRSDADTSSLIHHFCYGVAPTTFVLDARASFQPIRILSFKVALADAAAFHVILSAAANDLANLHGRSFSDQSVKHQGLALSLVNRRLSRSESLPSDNTIAATALLAGIELLFGTPETFNKHMGGLALMLKLRGGLKSLRKNNPLLHSLISWFDYAGCCNLASRRRFSPKSYSQHLVQSDPEGVPANILCNLPDQYDLYRHAISVLRALQMVTSTIQSSLSDDVMLSKSSTFVGRIDFELHQSVRLPELEGIKGRRRDIQQTCYLITLIFVAFASKKRLSGESTDLFLDRLEHALIGGSTAWSVAIADLFRLLFAEDEYYYSYKAYTAAIAKLMDVAFTLGCAPWRAIKNALLKFFFNDGACEGRLQTLWKGRPALVAAAAR